MLLHVDTKHIDLSIQTGNSVDFDGFSNYKRSKELEDIDDTKLTMKTVEDINQGLHLLQAKLDRPVTDTDSDNQYSLKGSVIRYCTRMTCDTNAIRSKKK